MGLLTVIALLIVVFGFGLRFGNDFGLRGATFGPKDYIQLFLLIPVLMVIISVIRGDWLIVVFGLILFVAGGGALGAVLAGEEDETDQDEQVDPDVDVQEVPRRPQAPQSYDDDRPPVF